MKSLISLIGFVAAANAYITRLPNCSYHADFLLRLEMYQTGEIQKTLTTETRALCAQECIVLDGCVVFNYQTSSHSCELLSKRFKKVNSLKDWVMGYTDINTSDIGPTCAVLSPCSDDEKCLDTCEYPGYRCETFVKLDVTDIQQSTIAFHQGITFNSSFAIDGDLETYSSTSLTKDSWLKIKFADVLFLHHLDILPGPNFQCEKKVFIVVSSVTPPPSDFQLNSFCGYFTTGQRRYHCNAFGMFVAIYGEKGYKCKIQFINIEAYT